MLNEAAEDYYIMGGIAGRVETEKTKNLKDNRRKIINKVRNMEEKNEQ